MNIDDKPRTSRINVEKISKFRLILSKTEDCSPFYKSSVDSEEIALNLNQLGC